MTAVVFETPGLIDVRAFTIIGAHAKPNSANPIGYFGTGLKFAIAVLVRLGSTPIVYIGKDRFSFHKKASTFRGSPLETIVMRVLKDGGKRPTSYEMPYTTHYGKNWKVWQAFRELESNTRDERGRTFIADEPIISIGASQSTRIIVDLPEFLEVAEKIDEIFLPRAKREGKLLEVLPGASSYIYYRTMRAMDLGKPSLFTYNILEQSTLTEDRTLAYSFQIRDVLARWVLTEATADQVESILKADDDCWEHGLEFPGHVAPSDAFREVMANRRRGIPKAAWSYYGVYAGPRRPRVEKTWALNDAHPRPWRVEGLEVLDAEDQAVFAAPDGYYYDWDQTAEAIVARINLLSRAPHPTGLPPLETTFEVIEPQAVPTDEGMPF